MAVILSNLKTKRKAAGFTQESLAIAADLSTRTIQRLEKGEEASFETAKSISSALQCSSYHDLCEAEPASTLVKVKHEQREKTKKQKISDAIKEMSLHELLPSNDQQIQRCGDAQSEVKDHWLLMLRSRMSWGFVPTVLIVWLSLSVALLFSFVASLPVAIGAFGVSMVTLFFGPHLLSPPSMRRAQQLAYDINLDRTLSTDEIYALKDEMNALISDATKGDIDAIDDLASSFYTGGDLLPFDKKTGITLWGFAAELGSKTAAESLLDHFRTQGSFCKVTKLDARQAAYESACLAKQLKSREGAEYIANIENPPKESIGLFGMLVSVGIGIAILS